jgi:hypothetical protein
MHVTILSMISGSSLQAFSAASTTAPLNGSRAANPVRLVRAQPDTTTTRQSSGPAPAIPDAKPSLPLPRGSLLNLSV